MSHVFQINPKADPDRAADIIQRLVEKSAEITAVQSKVMAYEVSVAKPAMEWGQAQNWLGGALNSVDPQWHDCLDLLGRVYIPAGPYRKAEPATE